MLNETRRRKELGESVRSIARGLEVDESSLRARLKRGYGVKSLGRFRKIFTEEQERMLAEHCKAMDQRFYGITRKMFRMMAYEFAEANEICHRFNRQNKLAGKDWTQCFLRRHNLSLRTPQKTSVGRIMGFNRIQVERFYENLSELMSKYKFPPDRIYNMDETGLTSVPNKIPKVIAVKGKRSVNKVSSAERGQLVTAVCSVSASGHYVPPALIYPRKRIKMGLLNGAPPGTILMLSDSGYINTTLFVDFLKHFQHHVNATEENPVLLILDNHSSHCSLEGVLYCRENNIHLLTIPPHSSHRTQPLDRCLFKALKDYHGEFCDQWLINHPGYTISQDSFAEIFGQAYNKVCTIEKAVNAFRVCGIVPLNKFIFTDEDFLPATVTDQRMIASEGNNEAQQEAGEDSFTSDDDIPLTHLKKKLPPCSNIQKASTSNDNLSEPSTSNYKSPQDLVPYPKISQERKRMRKGKKSLILTSTPNKEELENERNIKLDKQREKEAKKFLKKGKALAKKTQSSTESTICPGCEEPYTEPPLEDWIQCHACSKWWHESCSIYERGEFLCDHCII